MPEEQSKNGRNWSILVLIFDGVYIAGSIFLWGIFGFLDPASNASIYQANHNSMNLILLALGVILFLYFFYLRSNQRYALFYRLSKYLLLLPFALTILDLLHTSLFPDWLPGTF